MKVSSKRWRMRRTVENCLVVVAMIGILSAALVPAVARSRGKGHPMNAVSADESGDCRELRFYKCVYDGPLVQQRWRSGY